MDNAVIWFPLGESQVDKPPGNSTASCRYPHTIPPGWKVTMALSGIATSPVWRTNKGRHELVTIENVAYRLIEREMFFPEIMQRPVIHREVLQREVLQDFEWNAKEKKFRPKTTSQWRFLRELGLYSAIEELKELVEQHHRTRFPGAKPAIL